jgi:hypothetical protein
MGVRFTNSGFTVPVTSLGPGRYRLQVFARSTVTGTFGSSSRDVVVNPGPILSVDTPGEGTAVWPIFVFAGWAVDLRAQTGPGVDKVHVYAYPNPGSGATPVFLGEAPFGGIRPDVGRAFGARFAASSFGMTIAGLTPGDYEVVAYAHSTVTNSFNNAKAVRITVGPVVAVDTPGDRQIVGAAWTVRGWSVDMRAPEGTGVDLLHVWAYPESGGSPIFLGSPDYGGYRPDVADAFGARFGPSAYTLDVNSLPRGHYQVVVFSRSAATGRFDAARMIRLEVQ